MIYPMTIYLRTNSVRPSVNPWVFSDTRKYIRAALNLGVVYSWFIFQNSSAHGILSKVPPRWSQSSRPSGEIFAAQSPIHDHEAPKHSAICCHMSSAESVPTTPPARSRPTHRPTFTGIITESSASTLPRIINIYRHSTNFAIFQ